MTEMQERPMCGSIRREMADLNGGNKERLKAKGERLKREQGGIGHKMHKRHKEKERVRGVRG